MLQFNRNRSRPEGLDTRCRPCNASVLRAWAVAARERRKPTKAAAQAQRRATARRRVPWYDSAAVQALYAEAAARREAGEDVQVDHVVPLRSKLVCGLHVQGNLVIADRAENNRKGNRIWPDMPDFCSDSQTVLPCPQSRGQHPAPR